ncbi:LysM peptidoglycan-binding domain-containing protein [Branchiibius hedensis]|uniref:LysM peptidoglycan-binding domain-containing protein n=1 Tax=Branchiibius hedensis TaxID=672460 RepID=UPI0011B26D28|nr:LysM peptidoglycan-binding domain-containing protein [Branchiibius hedensis]
MPSAPTRPTLDAEHRWDPDSAHQPDDGTLALSAIKVIAWAAWAFLTLSIVLEISARVRGVRAPRLPGMRMPQSAAKGLVGTAILLFAASPIVAQTASAATLPTAQVSTVSATAQPGTSTLAAPAPSSKASPARASAPTTKHTVQPGETLWSIARDHLGAGERYTEIAALNHDLLGGRPGFLKTGWVLNVPAPPAPISSTTSPAPAEHTVTVQAGQTLSGIAQKELGNPNRFSEIADASKNITQPGGLHLTNPNRINAGWTLVIPQPSRSTTPRRNPRPPSPPHRRRHPAPFRHRSNRRSTPQHLNPPPHRAPRSPARRLCAPTSKARRRRNSSTRARHHGC